MYLVYGMIVMWTCSTGRCHLTLTSFSWFSGQNCVFLLFSNTIRNRLTIFGVWKYFMYMSISQVLFELDLIFTVYCSVLSVCVFLVCFSYTISNRSTILRYGMIVSCTCLPGKVYLTLISFSLFIGQYLDFLVQSVS